MIGNQEKKAIKAPLFAIQCCLFSIVCSDTPTLFNQIGLPNLPIQKFVEPPKKLPDNAIVKHSHGSIPFDRKKARINSELKGKIVAAKNEAKNKPNKPKVVKSKMYNFFKYT